MVCAIAALGCDTMGTTGGTLGFGAGAGASGGWGAGTGECWCLSWP
jgi:hypothetical protein